MKQLPNFLKPFLKPGTRDRRQRLRQQLKSAAFSQYVRRAIERFDGFDVSIILVERQKMATTVHRRLDIFVDKQLDTFGDYI